MTEQRAQYDNIGSKYEEYATIATIKRAERYTFFRLLGALGGKSVMDLACGFGFYTRMLKQHGASRVIGVDISPEMIRLADEKEKADPLGIDYLVCDAAALGELGHFDLVTAVYLFNYATSKDQMLRMFQSAYRNLAEGGRLIAYTVNPEFSLSTSNCTKYGNHVVREVPEQDRYACEAEFTTDPPTRFHFYRWNRATYDWAISEAGFHTHRFCPTEVAPEDVERYGEAYWTDLRNNSLVIGLTCHK